MSLNRQQGCGNRPVPGATVLSRPVQRPESAPAAGSAVLQIYVPRERAFIGSGSGAFGLGGRSSTSASYRLGATRCPRRTGHRTRGRIRFPAETGAAACYGVCRPKVATVAAARVPRQPLRQSSASDQMQPAFAVRACVWRATVVAAVLGSASIDYEGAAAQVPCVVPISGTETGHVSSIGVLPGGGALVDAERGWFRLDPASGTVTRVDGAEAGSVSIKVLPGGGALVGTWDGLFRLDPGVRDGDPRRRRRDGAGLLDQRPVRWRRARRRRAGPFPPRPGVRDG